MKPTDREVQDRNALALKIAMGLKERVAFLEHEGESKRPNIDAIRRECEAQREVIDAELAKYDAKHGTETEWIATESRLRQFIDKQCAYIDELHKVVQWEQAQCRQRDALLAGAVPIVQTLMALCEAHGVAIPDELMGVLQ
jgi:hypothetical protein